MGRRDGFMAASATVSALAIVEDEVRELVRRRSLDPAREPAAARRLIEEVLADYQDRAAVSTLPPLGDPLVAAGSLFHQVAGFGPLQPYLDDPEIEEIWINEPVKSELRLLYGTDRGDLRPNLPR
jgi:pilus assembly protein CpaF